MCGIAGAVFGETAVAVAEAAARSLSRRGPDGSGILREDGVTLVHARLAVIDLSDFAAQPMTSACGRFTIVFNGEIYNHAQLRAEYCAGYAFQSHSDTEVLLACFASLGPAMLEHLVGMFAFAIWDRAKAELFVVRDRLGVKPLYYTNSLADTFVFASRPTALFAMAPQLRRTIDRQALRYYYEAGYVPAPLSIFAGVAKLEPGHYLVVSANAIVKTQYWSADRVATDDSLARCDESRLLDQLDALVSESVRARMVSDVPIGAFLSGGIDSSLVVAMMARHASQPVHTFTIGFTDKAFDESDHALEVARHLGTVHTCENLAVDALLELMPSFIREYDEPFFDYSAFPVMAVSRLARRSVTVSLSGDGGDEAFGGYHYYKIMQHLETAHRLPQWLRNGLRHTARKFGSKKVSWLGEIVACPGPAAAFAFMRGTIKGDGALMNQALRDDTLTLAALFEQRLRGLADSLSYPEIGMRLDLAFTLPDDYLQKVDVGSMAFSLEARDPLLDHRIIEWAARLPLAWKLRPGSFKYLLRKLAYRYVPQALLDRPKMGFGVPVGDWLRGGLRQWGQSLLDDDEAFVALELDPLYVRKMWQDHQSGAARSHSALWTVLVALQFYRSHFMDIDTALRT
jgi:asparagine synthase (glutamine-hydrolysing)